MERDGDEQKERRKVSSESEIEFEWEIWIKRRFTTLLTDHQTWIQQNRMWNESWKVRNFENFLQTFLSS